MSSSQEIHQVDLQCEMETIDHLCKKGSSRRSEMERRIWLELTKLNDDTSVMDQLNNFGKKSTVVDGLLQYQDPKDRRTLLMHAAVKGKTNHLLSLSQEIRRRVRMCALPCDRCFLRITSKCFPQVVECLEGALQGINGCRSDGK